MPSQIDHSAFQGLQRRAATRTLELLAQAARYYHTSMPDPVILFDLRGQAAGQARTRAGSAPVIRYNAALLAAHSEDFIARTVPHEVAHLVAFRLHGRRIRPHGPEWRSVMALFGAVAERCHTYDVSGLAARRLQRYAYRCACRSHELTSIRHNRIRAGQVYLCAHCGVPLRAVSPPKPVRP